MEKHKAFVEKYAKEIKHFGILAFPVIFFNFYFCLYLVVDGIEANRKQGCDLKQRSLALSIVPVILHCLFPCRYSFNIKTCSKHLDTNLSLCS